MDDMTCQQLAAQAGYTGISVGKVDERYVMLPIHSIVDKGARKARRTPERVRVHRWVKIQNMIR